MAYPSILTGSLPDPTVRLMLSMRFLLLVALSLVAMMAPAEEPLPPEKAFKFSARVLDSQSLAVRYDIAPGYYMYREKFRFDASPAQLGTAELPRGAERHEFFGKVRPTDVWNQAAAQYKRALPCADVKANRRLSISHLLSRVTNALSTFG